MFGLIFLPEILLGLSCKFFVDTLDTLWHTQDISKDLEYPKCVKKFIENRICTSVFNQTFVSTEQVKIYFNLKPSINIKLLPSLKDACLYSSSFDILQDMFFTILRNFRFLHSLVNSPSQVSVISLNVTMARDQWIR